MRRRKTIEEKLWDVQKQYYADTESYTGGMRLGMILGLRWVLGQDYSYFTGEPITREQLKEERRKVKEQIENEMD